MNSMKADEINRNYLESASGITWNRVDSLESDADTPFRFGFQL